MLKDRRIYLEYRRKKWAAGVIAISWIMHVKMTMVRKQLIAARMDQLEGFRQRAKVRIVLWHKRAMIVILLWL